MIGVVVVPVKDWELLSASESSAADRQRVRDMCNGDRDVLLMLGLLPEAHA